MSALIYRIIALFFSYLYTSFDKLTQFLLGRGGVKTFRERYRASPASVLKGLISRSFKLQKIRVIAHVGKYKMVGRRFVGSDMNLLFKIPLQFEVGLVDILGVKEDMVVIDVGAYIGRHTLDFADRVGENGRVIAVEPDPENYWILSENIKMNKYQNVVLVNVAISDRDGTANLFISPIPAQHSLIFNNQGKPIVVKCKTLDSLVAELGLRKVDAIKIDVEGAELRVLRGASKLLTESDELKIIIEIHKLEQINSLKQFLKKKGFKVSEVKLRSRKHIYLFAKKEVVRYSSR